MFTKLCLLVEAFQSAVEVDWMGSAHEAHDECLCTHEVFDYAAWERPVFLEWLSTVDSMMFYVSVPSEGVYVTERWPFGCVSAHVDLSYGSVVYK